MKIDGNKRHTGGILLLMGAFGSEVLIGKWGLDYSWLQPSIDTCNWIGMAVSGAGWGHAAVKNELHTKSLAYVKGKFNKQNGGTNART